MPNLTDALNAGLAVVRADKSVSSVVVTGLSSGGNVYSFEIFRDESIRQVANPE
jgi:hypothetical protein